MKHQAKLRFHVISGPKPLSLGIIYWISRLPMCVCMCVYICTCSTHHRKCAAAVDSNPLLLELPCTPWYHCGWKSAFNNLEKSTRIYSFLRTPFVAMQLGTSKWTIKGTLSSIQTLSCYLSYYILYMCCVFVNCALSHTTLFTLKVDKIDYSTIDCFCSVNDLCTNYCFTSETRE